MRLSGPDLQNLNLEIQGPDGTTEQLDAGVGRAGQTIWVASYNTTSFGGWQPRGTWSLTISNVTSSTVTVEDFAVVTRGSFHRQQLGQSATPIELPLRSGTLGRRVIGTTASYVSSVNLSCANTPGPDRFYEFTLPAANTVSVRAVAGFDSALELRLGPCATGTVVLACDDNSLIGTNPRIAPMALNTGTYCVVVDSVSSSGKFDLTLSLATAAP